MMIGLSDLEKRIQWPLPVLYTKLSFPSSLYRKNIIITIENVNIFTLEWVDSALSTASRIYQFESLPGYRMYIGISFKFATCQVIQSFSCMMKKQWNDYSGYFGFIWKQSNGYTKWIYYYSGITAFISFSIRIKIWLIFIQPFIII